MKNIQRILSGLLILILLFSTFPLSEVYAAGTVYYVKANATGSNDGSSWTNAYTSLQSAIAVATSGDEIWVAAGIYKPTNNINRKLSFTPKVGVAIYGGFAGTETLLSERNWATNVTTLSGNIGAQNSTSDNSFHVVYISKVDNVRLDGFTITDGNASATTANYFGGGIYSIGNENLTLENLMITSNLARLKGGGLYDAETIATKLTNVSFIANYADEGGAMFDSTTTSMALVNVSFVNNTADDGGGLSNVNASPSLKNVTFSENRVTGVGGGMQNKSVNFYASPTLLNVTFKNNTAREGGGMVNISYAEWDDQAYAYPQLTNVNFNGNSAKLSGGGMQNNSYAPPDFDYWGALDPILTNVNFFNNSAGTSGGGMENHFHANAHLTNVTFSSNSAATGGGISTKDYSNVVLQNVTFNKNFASDTGGWLYNENSTPSFAHVTASGNTAIGNTCGINNKNAKPSFANSIFWDNGTEYCSNSNATFENSIIQGGCPAGNTCIQSISANPLLSELKNNGGFTKTMSLATNSPALDIGNSSKCTTPDQRGVERPQGPFCDAGAYEKEQSAVTLSSQAVNDGWIVGFTKDSKDSIFSLGDDDQNRQYRAILSFNTASLSLPAGAIISSVRLKLKAQSDLATNLSLYYALGDLIFDIHKGPFGNDVGLELRDFNAASSKDDIGRVSKTPVNGLYIETWKKSIAPYINLNGSTQFRLRLAKLTNNDNTLNTMQFFSGDAVAADRPQLIVYYYVP